MVKQISMHRSLDINSRIKMNHGGSIPYLGLGVWQISDGKHVIDAVTNALNTGYRLIDTAKIYGNEKGVGKAIRKSDVSREDIFVTTKLWNSDHNDVESAFEQSLDRLGLDYIDLYLIHWPASMNIETWKSMERLVKTKQCKAIGVSNFSIMNLKEIIKNAKIIPAVNQVAFHPYQYEKKLLDFCKSSDIILEAYSPLARGRILNDRRLSDIATHYGKTSAQLLLKWCIQKGVPAIPKSENIQRIVENADIFDFEIVEEDRNFLDTLNKVE